MNKTIAIAYTQKTDVLSNWDDQFPIGSITLNVETDRKPYERFNDDLDGGKNIFVIESV